MPETRHEKTVKMVAYDSDLDYPDLRDWVNSMCELDLLETTTEERDKVWLTVDTGRDEKRIALKPYNFNGDGYEDFGEWDPDNDMVTVEREQRTETIHKQGVKSGAKQLVESICKEIGAPIDVGGVEMVWDDMHYKKLKWVSDEEEIDHVITVSGIKPAEKRILAKESERQSDDMYETTSKVPAIRFNITADSSSEEFLDAVSEELIPFFHKALSGNPSIGKVRYMDCRRTTTEEGECYNI